jgi:hypothetical protein
LEGYPFTHAELLRALWRYLDDSGCQITDLQTLPDLPFMPGGWGDRANEYQQRRFVVTVSLNDTIHQVAFTLHQHSPLAMWREYGLHTQLAEHLLWIPLVTPGFLMGNPNEGWVVLQDLEHLLHPSAWRVDDYREAMDNLAALHDRYWGLQEDLDNFMWLWQPLERDYPPLQASILQAGQDLLTLQQHPEWSNERHRALLEHLLEKNAAVRDWLRCQPLTLTHGSYWAGNLAARLDGRQIITHWYYAAIAPPILDAVMFHQSTLSHLQPSQSVDGSLQRYRAKLEALQGLDHWTDAAWEQQWDYALLWLFNLHWMERLAQMPNTWYKAIHARMDSVWIKPVALALHRQFGVVLPP